MIAAFTQELARHVDPGKVIVDSLCPGMVSTGLDVNLPLWLKPIMWPMRLLRARTSKSGLGRMSLLLALRELRVIAYGCSTIRSPSKLFRSGRDLDQEV